MSRQDARFLFRKALIAGTTVAVEVGTGSGFSTVILCHAQDTLSKAGVIGRDFAVVSCDRADRVGGGTGKKIGDAARELLPPALLEHISFRNPEVAANLRDSFGRDEVGFMFLDANHRHPWPTLDLLGALDVLAPGAIVVVHDINLKGAGSEDLARGAEYLFDGLDEPNDVPHDEGVAPNIGSFAIPRDKDRLRDQLLRILFDHQWEAIVGEDITSLALA